MACEQCQTAENSHRKSRIVVSNVALRLITLSSSPVSNGVIYLRTTKKLWAFRE